MSNENTDFNKFIHPDSVDTVPVIVSLIMIALVTLVLIGILSPIILEIFTGGI